MLTQIYLFFWLLAIVYNSTLLSDLYFKGEFTLGDMLYQWTITNLVLLILHPFLLLIYLMSILQGIELHTIRREFMQIHKDSLRRFR